MHGEDARGRSFGALKQQANCAANAGRLVWIERLHHHDYLFNYFSTTNSDPARRRVPGSALDAPELARLTPTAWGSDASADHFFRRFLLRSSSRIRRWTNSRGLSWPGPGAAGDAVPCSPSGSVFVTRAISLLSAAALAFCASSSLAMMRPLSELGRV